MKIFKLSILVICVLFLSFLISSCEGASSDKSEVCEYCGSDSCCAYIGTKDCCCYPN